MNKQVNKITPNLKPSAQGRQRGNTLVPVVIGLGIAAVATAAFISQGADLANENNLMLAKNELTSLLGDVNLANVTGVGVTSGLLASTNIYGNTNEYTAANKEFKYKTDNAGTCATLKEAVSNYVNGSSCDSETLKLTIK